MTVFLLFKPKAMSMFNLYVAIAGFWPITKHWKNRDKAKIELSCDAGSLHIQLSAILGHPDQPHFPHPPFPSFTRKEAASRVEETVNYLVKETESKPLEKNTEIETNVT